MDKTGKTNHKAVNDEQAFWFGRVLLYLNRNQHAARSMIYQYVGLPRDIRDEVFEYLHEQGLIETIKSGRYDHLEITQKGRTAAIYYERWLKYLGIE